MMNRGSIGRPLEPGWVILVPDSGTQMTHPVHYHRPTHPRLDTPRHLKQGIKTIRTATPPALAIWLAQIEPLLEPDCAFSWITPGGRVEVRALDDRTRRVG
jgi:hypothetical protein